jgi:hypothetical protein
VPRIGRSDAARFRVWAVGANMRGSHMARIG